MVDRPGKGSVGRANARYKGTDERVAGRWFLPAGDAWNRIPVSGRLEIQVSGCPFNPEVV